MRLNLLLASLLVVPFACGDDGGGDDDGADTSNGTANTGADDGMTTAPTAPTTAADDGGQTTDDGGQTTDDGGQTTDDGGQTTDDGGQTTGDVDSSGDGDSSSGGGVSKACVDFCADYFGSVCGPDEANDYGDEGTCGTLCDAWPADELGCKVMHLGLANAQMLFHCGHANEDGGGTC